MNIITILWISTFLIVLLKIMDNTGNIMKYLRTLVMNQSIENLIKMSEKIKKEGIYVHK